MGLSNLFVPWGMLLVDNIVLRAKTIEEANETTKLEFDS